MKSLQEYSQEWRGGEACARQGKSFSDYNPLIDDPLDFLELTESEREPLLDWIKRSIIPRKTICRHHSSYGLKHVYESDTGNYVTNGQFKGAMITEGYEPHDASALNPHYAISKDIRVNR